MTTRFFTLIVGIALLFCIGCSNPKNPDETTEEVTLSSGVEAQQRGDFETAAAIFDSLAKQGDAYAQYNLGVAYHNGNGVPQDYEDAVEWYLKSAEQEVPKAQYGLGSMYHGGHGVPQDYKEAIKWYRKSAEQGYSEAQNILGLMYRMGLGVTQDNVFAHMWFNIAASFANDDGAGNRNIVAEEMTKDQIAEAQKLARECVKKDYKDC